MAAFGIPLSAGEALSVAQPPLSLARFGSYFAGGRQVTVTGQPLQDIRFSSQAGIEHDPNGTFHIEGCYVQFFVLDGAKGRLPIVLVHGGCLTGAMWETTPDGRPGWLDRLLRAGHPVHVIDGVERGRAGWCALPGLWPEQPIARSAEQMWTLYRLGAAEGFASRTAFAGQRHPVASMDVLLQQHVPRWFSTIPAAVAALIAVLERSGPAILLSHSNGGLIAFEAAWQRPDLVAGVVSVEPSGFPTADIPAALAGTPFLFMMGDYLNATPLWHGLSDAMTELAYRLRRVGARVTDWRLPTLGIHGNSHLPMMDDNSDELAGMITSWIYRETGARR